MTDKLPDLPKLIEMFKEGTSQLVEMGKQIDKSWDPNVKDMRLLHNMYIENMLSCYTSKFAELSVQTINSIEAEDYLIYALCGRSLIETIATLRYYIFHEYLPIFKKEILSSTDLEKLIEIDERHFQGSRFDWESFLLKKYSKLKLDTIESLAEKKKKKNKNDITKFIKINQTNVLTCVEKWAEEESHYVLIAYNLFCDLVHPNIGSNFMVTSIADGRLQFSKYHGKRACRQIFEQSFSLLALISHGHFGDLILRLLSFVLPDNESL